MNYRFNIKNGFTETFEIIYPKNVIKKNHNNKSVQSFYKIAILKNFAKFTRKHLCWNPFFIEFSGLQLYLTRGSSTDLFKNAFSLKHLRPVPKFHGPTPPTPKFLPTLKFYRPTQPPWRMKIFGPRHSRTHAPRTHASPRNPHNLADSLTTLTWNNLCFTEFSTKFIEIHGWLLLTFFIYLHNQLSSFNSIIVQMSEKRDSSNKQ